MNLCATRTALLLLFTPVVFASSNTDLSVSGTITPSACAPLISDGGMVDFGKMSAKSLNADQHTSLPNQSMRVSCAVKAPLFSPSTPSITAPARRPTMIGGMALGMTPNDKKSVGQAFTFTPPLRMASRYA